MKSKLILGVLGVLGVLYFLTIIFVFLNIALSFNFVYTLTGIAIFIGSHLLLIFAGVFLISTYLEDSYKEKPTKVSCEVRDYVKSFEIATKLSDYETGEHITRVNLYSRFIAKELGCSKLFQDALGTFASLHDVGKVGIPDAILKKPGKLSPSEFRVIKKHPLVGHKVIKTANFSKIAENIVLHHHERWSGGGYPFGLKGEDIPLEARIVTLADIYDSLRQERVYKEGFSHEKAISIIVEEDGKILDPSLVKLFKDKHLTFKDIFDSNQ